MEALREVEDKHRINCNHLIPVNNLIKLKGKYAT